MIYKHEFKAMGCHMLAAIASPSPHVKTQLAKAPEWFEGWEASLSRFRADSELSRLNRSPEAAIPVSETFWNVFLAAIEAEKQSDGLVTPTTLGALVAAGYASSFDPLALPQAASTTATGQALSLSSIQWDGAARTIRLPAGVQLDFGGVAKGWSAHQAMKRLQGYGPALVDAGGDIAISGLLPGGEPWGVGIDDPFHPGNNLETLVLGHCGVATSGTDYHRWKQGEAWKHHIIDPRTGEPAETDVLSATVVAPTVMEAEMAAKVALILGSRAGMNWLEERPAYAGLLVQVDGQVIYGRRIERYLER
jgi:thiamine biosynthesis lipoprotein